MNQNIWGSHLWFSLHTISFNYPLKPTQEDKDNYLAFFLGLKNVIPCAVCKKNYLRHLNEHPIDNFLGDRRTLVYWLIDLHNMVNVEIGKKVLSYDIVIKKYEDAYGKKINMDTDEEAMQIKYEKSQFYKKAVMYFLLFLIVLFFINFIIFFKSKKMI
jgi:hypothetical protein